MLKKSNACTSRTCFIVQCVNVCFCCRVVYFSRDVYGDLLSFAAVLVAIHWTAAFIVCRLASFFLWKLKLLIGGHISNLKQTEVTLWALKQLIHYQNEPRCKDQQLQCKSSPLNFLLLQVDRQPCHHNLAFVSSASQLYINCKEIYLSLN